LDLLAEVVNLADSLLLPLLCGAQLALEALDVAHRLRQPEHTRLVVGAALLRLLQVSLRVAQHLRTSVGGGRVLRVSCAWVKSVSLSLSYLLFTP
jgi:hypothetical protein